MIRFYLIFTVLFKLNSLEEKDNKFMGTPYFCSLPMAKKNEYSRRDDIESVIYCLAYLIKAKLPWDQDYYLIEEEK